MSLWKLAEILELSPDWGTLFQLKLFIVSITRWFSPTYLIYGLVTWGQAAKSHLEKITVLQKKAVRLIHFAPFRSHAIPYFVQSNTIPITMLYFKHLSILMHDVSNNLAPKNISNCFTLNQNIHQYSTRSSTAGNYYINFSKTNQHKNSFSVIGAKIWNSLLGSTRNLPKHMYKKSSVRPKHMYKRAKELLLWGTGSVDDGQKVSHNIRDIISSPKLVQ